MQAGCTVTCLQSCPLQMFGLQWSTSNTWLVLQSLSPAHSLLCSLISIFLSHSWAARTDSLFSLTPSFHSPVSASCFSSLFHCFFFNPSFPLLCDFSLCLLSATVTPIPLLCLLYVLAFLGLRAWWWWDLITLAGWSSPDIPCQAVS